MAANVPLIDNNTISESEKDDLSSLENCTMKTHMFKVKVPTEQLRTTEREAKLLLKEMRKQTALVTALWAQQFEDTRRLEAELELLQQQVIEQQNEIIEIKRKRWCSVCENEAIYMDESGNSFFCSTLCEEEHQKQCEEVAKLNIKIIIEAAELILNPPENIN